ncbi:hypothetical protein [Neobacillus niacini]|uniref:hypothetical protein n=1 Tax=Neobacillus niacini TaxID=86668 RepID=UPI00286077C9|nr:hypothetical protein [Neobacillus niacini]MDR7000989.1 hypothetical protein [Neobacillus niacini]
MENYQSRFLKMATASVIGISIFAAIVVVPVKNHPNYVYAKTTYTYKVLNGKLVDAKRKKIIKGYAVYSKKLYYNGILKKGYAVYSNKLYNNGSLKKGYTVYSNKLYNNGILKKGYAVYSKKLYYNGSLKKGYTVYKNKLYYNGSLKSGYETYNSILYSNGILFTGTYKSVYYKSGVKFTGRIGDKKYKNGVIVETANSKIRSISNQSGSIFTNITVTTSADVYKVKLGSEEMHYIGNYTFTYGLANVKTGTILSVYAYDENNKLLQTMKYTVD